MLLDTYMMTSHKSRFFIEITGGTDSSFERNGVFSLRGKYHPVLVLPVYVSVRLAKVVEFRTRTCVGLEKFNIVPVVSTTDRLL
jgi:hypothetical protein